MAAFHSAAWSRSASIVCACLISIVVAGSQRADGSSVADEPIVFVSRQIPPYGSYWWDVPNSLPGVGPFSRFQVAAPGRLLVREAGGNVRVLLDGSAPTAASLNLVDFNAPDVSYDGSRVVFAGLRAGNHELGPVTNPNAWRLYSIRADGSDLRQITFDPTVLDLAQFGAAAINLQGCDDTDPAYLPDGRIVFSSTRWPSFAQYSNVRTTNLHVVNADGGALHRITSERSGADRPRIDPLTGKIVYSRWWRNHRFPIDSLATIISPQGGYEQKDGLSSVPAVQLGGPNYLWRIAWHAATIRPDGTDLAMWSGWRHSDIRNHVYGGDFTAEGDFIGNFFPSMVMTKAAGFGGLRRFFRGARLYAPVAGITDMSTDHVNPSNPTSLYVYNGEYFAEPAVMSDGTLVVSRAPDVAQDYGLYRMQANGTGLALLYDLPGTSELRARRLSPRSLPPVLPDQVTQVASLLPPTATGPFGTDGTFVFDALNVYANAPVDTDIISAPPVGSASRLRFFLDHQRTSPGSYPNLDWPILLGERRVSASGRVPITNAPADVPLFEQLRDAAGNVPFTGGPARAGAGHVAGLNYGRPGSVSRCVGCHAGHTLMPVPATAAEAAFTNLAPGASVTVSSSRDALYNACVVDRRVLIGATAQVWTSASGQAQGQWVELLFPVPVTVKTVRLYRVRPSGEAQSTLQVTAATVQLFANATGTTPAATRSTGTIALSGTDVTFSNVRTRRVRVLLDQVSGTWYGLSVAGLSEIEVIARGEAP